MAVLLAHVAIVAGLVRVFTPDLEQRVVRSAMQVFSIAAEPPPSPPSPVPSSAPQSGGAAGAAGRKAVARETVVVPAPVVVRTMPAAPASGPGDETVSGSRESGTGTGGVDAGGGPGAGGQGGGTGGGATPTVKIAGEINSARDYPRASRALRIGAFVVIDLAVGTDGRVASCRVSSPSPDPAADAVTCRLATQRFRFTPARNGAGEPVPAVYRWRQRWFH